MKISKLSVLNSIFLIIDTYGIFMSVFSSAFQSVIFKKSFFSGLGAGIILLQIMISILNIFLIFLFFRKELLEFLKGNKLDKIIISVSLIILVLPINFFIKILLFCIIYIVVEFVSKIRNKNLDDSIMVVLLSTILGLFLLISYFVGY